MADDPPYVGNNAAPFIYFDYVPTFGLLAGAIQIELAARTILPIGDGKVSNETVCTGHLRMSPAAAIALQDALAQSIEMWKQSTQAPPPSAVN